MQNKFNYIVPKFLKSLFPILVFHWGQIGANLTLFSFECYEKQINLYRSYLEDLMCWHDDW